MRQKTPPSITDKASKKSFSDWVVAGFWAMGNAVAIYVGSQIRDMGSEMRGMSVSMSEMNGKLAKYIERSEFQSRDISDLKISVSDLKTRINSVELILPNVILTKEGKGKYNVRSH